LKVYFRELTIDDIPAIKDISKDIWEGNDYIPQVIHEWLQEKNCMNYGTFIDEQKTEMIGFGRVKLYNDDIAWLEGGRIKVSYQKQGIGRKQLKYAIDYSSKVGAKVAQYDTASTNLGSIKLANYFGFKKKKCMDLVRAKSSDIKIFNRLSTQIKDITIEDAKELLNKFDVAPGDEVCIGWSFVPKSHITKNHGSWIYNGDAILLKIEYDNFSNYGLPLEQEFWLIVYGKPKAARELIQYVIQTKLESQEPKIYEVFCKLEDVDVLKDMGFKYPEGERFGVILFEKNLN